MANVLKISGGWKMNQKQISEETKNWYNALKKSEKWNYYKIKRFQLCRLQQLSKVFGLKINTWKDFYKLPLTTKNNLRKYKPQLPKNYTAHYTSGSTGEPLKIYGPEELQFIKSAVFERAWEWVDWDRKRWILRLTAGKPQWEKSDKWRHVKPMNYRTINNKTINYVLKKHPFIIHGGSGSIREITTKILKKNKRLDLIGVNLYLMSEDTGLHKKELEKYYYGVYSGYGLGECCTVASECKQHSIHVNMETCIVESINGELVITDLFNTITPVIRYRTKDLGLIKKSKCKCGLTHDVIINLQGRGVDYYDGLEVKKPLSWWVLSPITHKYIGIIKQWKVIVYPRKWLYELHVVWKGKKYPLNWYKEFVEKKTGLVFKIVTHKRMSNKSRLNLMKIK